MTVDYLELRRTTMILTDAAALVSRAAALESAGDLHAAAIALDRAFGLQPDDRAIRAARLRMLDQLSLTEHGISFRYIPGGTFFMGSTLGDPDEAPVHAVELDYYWLSETPISWACFCRIMDWDPPPAAMPRGLAKVPTTDKHLSRSYFYNRIRLQYCEDETLRAIDWHAHLPEHYWKTPGTGESTSSRKIFGEPPRRDPSKPFSYETKPMVAVQWQDAVEFSDRLKTLNKRDLYGLPTEAQWEKAARGGLARCRYAWGKQQPSPILCDFNRFEQFSILPVMGFPPNGYGLFAMSGSVWEWTADWFDSQYYEESPRVNPSGPRDGKSRVVRGGSWCDCAEALTVSFRMSLGEEGPLSAGGPNIGFRVSRNREI